MISLEPNEKIIKIVHKHWFTLLPQGVLFLFLILTPSLLIAGFYSFPIVFPFIMGQNIFPELTNFGLSLYMLFLVFFIFIVWIDYYLDMWIITTTRIIDIEQRGLFNREVSEIPIVRVQDITIDVSGIIKTFLKFGTIRIQTAGEREFVINNIPHLQEIKDIILHNKTLLGKAWNTPKV